mgnify:CR=1 FL=1
MTAGPEGPPHLGGGNQPTSPSGGSGVSDLKARVLSAIVLAPIVLAIVWIGSWPFAVLAAAAAAILIGEWSGISRSRYVDAAVAVAGTCLFAAVLAFAAGYGTVAGVLVLAGALAGQALAWPNDPARLFGTGVFYAGLPMLALVALRSDPAYGLAAIIFLLIVVWTTDIGAYFAGRAMGGPKLAPRISPKKTWSGAIGGLVAAVVASALFVWFLLPADLLPDTLLPLILLAAVLSAVSQCGDLLESALKRRFDVKDSSRLIPGHGGLMDRVDALIVAAVAGGLVGVARGGADAAGAGLLLW